ncbi:hypothetical protein SAMN05443245_5272 [Paraburkholderia fungorum]|uniref:Lipoprotein n=1 Tax=Paraburkholderia fungorum TaxID=134537 RepID=A0A1H1IJC0_9BURK|nr:hypothetical protein [Paraburkholderia fungorum]SDR37837.1 hypothetical protein SAMN05443245_5272 [Paraburkholderia fungorum]
MKKIIAAFAAGIVALALGACSTSQLSTAQQLFASDCSVVNADLQALSTSTLLNADQQGKITQLLTANKAVCSAVASADVSTLKNINDSLLPAAIIVVSAVPAIPNQPAILLALNTIGPVLQQLVDQAITASTASSATAASAPVAASQ